jgi:hypothetical protein
MGTSGITSTPSSRQVRSTSARSVAPIRSPKPTGPHDAAASSASAPASGSSQVPSSARAAMNTSLEVLSCRARARALTWRNQPQLAWRPTAYWKSMLVRIDDTCVSSAVWRKSAGVAMQNCRVRPRRAAERSMPRCHASPAPAVVRRPSTVRNVSTNQSCS